MLHAQCLDGPHIRAGGGEAPPGHAVAFFRCNRIAEVDSRIHHRAKVSKPPLRILGVPPAEYMGRYAAWIPQKGDPRQHEAVFERCCALHLLDRSLRRTFQTVESISRDAGHGRFAHPKFLRYLPAQEVRILPTRVRLAVTRHPSEGDH